MAGHVVKPSTKFEDPTAIRSWAMSSDISHRIPLTAEGRSLGGKISGETGRPPANILIPLESNWLRYNFAADSFYIVKLCSRLFVHYCRSRHKDDKSRHFGPHFEEVRGGVEPWLSAIELLFLSLAVEALKGKRVQNSLTSGGEGHLEPRFQGKGVVPLPIYWYHSKGN